MKTYNAIKHMLTMIEQNLDRPLSIEFLAKETGISSTHLQRVFMMAFHVPLAKYIRLRKLSASLKKLAFSDYRVVDIANEYGFEHEQSYIRAFKREFNMTPGQFKSKCMMIKTTSPLTMADFIATPDGILSVPDIVILPRILIVGDSYMITPEESVEKAPKVAREFWENNRFKIKNAINKDVYTGLTRMNEQRDKSIYLSGMQVSDIKSIPEGLSADSLPPSEYLRFYYIGEHHPYELNQNVMHEMYNAIDRYMRTNTKYLLESSIWFERVDESKYDGTYCFMEWLMPISLRS